MKENLKLGQQVYSMTQILSIRREIERWMNGINDTVNNTGDAKICLITELI